MDINKVNQILVNTTQLFRKGEPVVKSNNGGIRVVEIWAMPHQSEASADLEQVDCHFMIIGVNKAKAEEVRDELVLLLYDYPGSRLAEGLSFIEVGGMLGDQEMAFRLFALGKVLGFWEIITPEFLGVIGSDADELAGSGMIFTSGYNPR